jgi:hypothetical protein
MRGAFVIRLSLETQPDNNRFEGWAEEVDSGEEIKFRSAEELLRFLGRRFAATLDGLKSGGPAGACDVPSPRQDFFPDADH